MKKKLKFSSAYMEEPIVIIDDNIFCHYAAHELNISKDLAKKIQHWDDLYQDTLDHNYPPDSDFQTEEDKRKHQVLGKELAQKLQNELGPEFNVKYYSDA